MANTDDLLKQFSPIHVYGKVHRIVGLVVEGSVARSSIGSLCEIVPLHEGEPVPAEIVGYSDSRALIMPLGELRGLGPGSLIRVRKQQATISIGEAMLGRVLDGMGQPLDQVRPSSCPTRSASIRCRSAPCDGRRSASHLILAYVPSTGCSPAASASAWASWPAPAWAKACCWA